jgi:NADPH:quinone reductase
VAAACQASATDGLQAPAGQPGIEVSGWIRELGAGVADLSVGQAVAALTIVNSGEYAEVVTAAADLVAPIGDLPLDVAAVMPSNGTTAFVLLDRVARLEPGQSVLVHAAAGDTASQLGQVARMFGDGRVLGTVGSAAKVQNRVQTFE